LQRLEIYAELAFSPRQHSASRYQFYAISTFIETPTRVDGTFKNTTAIAVETGK
jgi:hypothetical protein